MRRRNPPVLIGLLNRIPYAIEQGKFSAAQGIDLTEQGILVRHQRTARSVAGGDRTEAPSIVFAAEGFLPSDKESSPDRVFGPYR